MNLQLIVILQGLTCHVAARFGGYTHQATRLATATVPRGMLIIPMLFTLIFLGSASNPSLEPQPTASPRHRIAVVGGGIAGTSFAALARAALAHDSTELVLFEREPVLGGRVASHDFSGTTVELGASVYHRENRLVRSFVELLNLTSQRPLHAGRAGVWKHCDNAQCSRAQGRFLFLESRYTALTLAAVLWRYGSSPFVVRSLIRQHLQDFLGAYSALATQPAVTALGILAAANLSHLPDVESGVYLRGQGVGDRFVTEFATAITRANYGSSMSLNGFAGAVSLAGSGADLFSVVEGNQRLAEGAARLAGAHVRLNTTVLSIGRGTQRRYTVTVAPRKGCEPSAFLDGDSGSCDATSRPDPATAADVTTEEFDSVVIASPIQHNGIQFSSPLDMAVSMSLPKSHQQDYRTTHATFIRGMLKPGYFGMDVESELPTTILTTEPELNGGANPSEGPIHFSSIGALKQFNDGTRLFKVFSRFRLTARHLEAFLQWKSEESKDECLGSAVRRAWRAYPYLKAAPSQRAGETDVPFVLDDGGKESTAKEGGLFYVNAMEAYVSTMETEMLAACNTAYLLKARLQGVTEDGTRTPSCDLLTENLRAVQRT